MANLKEIRSRISSVSSTMQITGAMKMVSAAKLKKAQDAILAMKPYAYKLKQLLEQLSSALGSDNVYNERPEGVANVLIVPITSNRGLCGAFNSNISKKALELETQKYKNLNVKFYTIGKKGNDVLKKTDKVFRHETQIFDNLNFAGASELASELMELYTSGQFDKIVLVYNSFKNAATQIVMEETFLPIQTVEAKESATDYIFEPSKEQIVEELIPRSLKIQFFKALRDSVASEHGARMTAMHKATDNANELRSQLKLTYNKARQAAITGEILEIVGGAEALS
ncbi:ATP synthase gamma chain [Capnocytophaga canimorsus]|uniref:ATP synthase gamma chain n=1 Tax=Capnocytophaga canimorsus TaxID=28188 RepID=A0A0B7HMM5_9FLAO|nr:ATP synthase F1 subunit gamma [Capnocytophaga canimorsus]ATA77500.1 ATP synthase F1 subunit gamma [Capnocytophaga canimorsus]PJI82477.1 F-type H+-transporting ATPase subunit gamma [Capnocytophaga canimorsus]CEN38738.1 ATP synthase gamma chain [Capnocytophaga canimorsus]STA72767.1 F-ATPase gamma subunit [Capnocytophaga canimorsus]